VLPGNLGEIADDVVNTTVLSSADIDGREVIHRRLARELVNERGDDIHRLAECAVQSQRTWKDCEDCALTYITIARTVIHGNKARGSLHL
jgi:hypothetical protein